jgi:HAD superfamily hydrolase (TIGR01509 family)
MVKAVLFDVGGVLLELGEDAYRRDIARMYGLSALPAWYEEAVPGMQRGEIDEAAIWARLAGRPVDSRAYDVYWRRYYLPIQPMLNLAARLREEGIRTAILSNTVPSHVRIMHTMDFLAGFDPVIFSCEARARKPEAAIYLLALEQLGLPAHAVAYIDDVPEFVDAATALGIRAILHSSVAETAQALAALGLAGVAEYAGA